MITRTTFHLQGGIDAKVKARNISPPNRKPSAAGSGFRTEDLWVTCRPPYPSCHSGYPSTVFVILVYPKVTEVKGRQWGSQPAKRADLRWDSVSALSDGQTQQFQDSADRTRKKTQGRIQGAQQPRQKTKQNQWFTVTRPKKAAEYN